MSRAFVVAVLFAGLLATPAVAQNAAQVDRVQNAQGSCPGCDLLQIELSFETVTGRNFSGARLMQAGMTGGIYDGNNFAGANLRFLSGAGSRFSRANFTGADLSEASLVGSYFGRARFSRANLAGANLSGSDLSTATGVTQGQLDQACGDDQTLLPRGLSIPFCR